MAANGNSKRCSWHFSIFQTFFLLVLQSSTCDKFRYCQFDAYHKVYTDEAKSLRHKFILSQQRKVSRRKKARQREKEMRSIKYFIRNVPFSFDSYINTYFSHFFRQKISSSTRPLYVSVCMCLTMQLMVKMWFDFPQRNIKTSEWKKNRKNNIESKSGKAKKKYDSKVEWMGASVHCLLYCTQTHTWNEKKVFRCFYCDLWFWWDSIFVISTENSFIYIVKMQSPAIEASAQRQMQCSCSKRVIQLQGKITGAEPTIQYCPSIYIQRHKGCCFSTQIKYETNCEQSHFDVCRCSMCC